MRKRLSTINIADAGAKVSGDGTPDYQRYEITERETRELVSQLRTLEASLAELRSFSQEASVYYQKLQADYAALVEKSAAERTAPGEATSAWCAETKILLGSKSALAQTLAGISQANASAAEIVARLRQEIDLLSTNLQQRKNQRAQREQAISELEARLGDAVREMRNGEEYARQVILELLRVREEQEATQRCAEAAETKAALACQQREEIRTLLRKSESIRLEMEQTPGWWLITSFHGWMKHSPVFAQAIGLIVKGARVLRLLPIGCTQEAQRIAPLVDREYYFRTYPEAKAWGVPAAEHYLRIGASKGYNPSPAFDTQFYLTQYPDVASAGANPLLHYVDVGASEGRRTHAGQDEAASGTPTESLGEQAGTAAELQVAHIYPAPDGIKLPERFAMRPHRELVSIIVTVHNALEYVRDCLSSILHHTAPPYELVLVDDGSEPHTCEYLRRFAAQQGAVLIRSEAASGYTLAANRGLRAARGEYVLLLNSDTIVTENWLDRMVMCAESDPHIGIVGPLSNRANWQSIPEAVKDGAWAENELPENWTAHDMARAVAASTGRTYPRIPFLNGFCLLIKRQVLEGVGYFDEVNFGRGYGEESDYCLRARAHGWVSAVADDAYVYHARTKSYPIERRDELSEVAHRMLYTKHKKVLIDRCGEQARDDLVLLGIRARASEMFARHSLIEEGRRRWEGKRIAFLLPIGEQCDAADVVLAEAKAMEAFGASVLIVNLLANMQAFRSAYLDLDLRVVFVPGGADVRDSVQGYDAVIATTHDSLFPFQELAVGPSAPILAYYILEFEPGLFPQASSTPNLIRLSKTTWNRDQVLNHAGVDCTVVGLSCDVDLFRPRVVPSTGKVNVSTIIRPSLSRSAARETMELLAQVDRQYGDRVAVHIFGVDSRNPALLDLPGNFQWMSHGVRTREQMAALLSAQEIFVDLFDQPPVNLTALEAMACGAAVVLPQMHGCSAFAIHGENAIVADTSNRAACFHAIGGLIEESESLAKLRRRALTDAARFWPEKAAFNILNALFLEKDPAQSFPAPAPSFSTAKV